MCTPGSTHHTWQPGAQAPASRLILVGIANSIDLTERALPKLESTGHAAQLITFPSYSAAQLGTLLSAAMSGLPGPAVNETALKFCAKAVCPGPLVAISLVSLASACQAGCMCASLQATAVLG